MTNVLVDGIYNDGEPCVLELDLNALFRYHHQLIAGLLDRPENRLYQIWLAVNVVVAGLNVHIHWERLPPSYGKSY